MNHKSAITQQEEQWLLKKHIAEKARADAAEERERILKQAIWELIK
ncbi:hypothetical protein [Paenibacillus larvae]|uniref:Uncharacterized protein n=1 Tax=Paenibacillus larvae subsp. larvae TaxID=147375 RepID=A0A6C0QS15_9BACL|nr:hypothetical protein [Paenibacillus larvae]QHZ51301.1 hypothetical protein ERICV_02154 [Paenibacillus larvae subsp. larvae]QHZ52438.1 hypothetical protein ERICV_03327 [Paenibacillus larvae subsp. larvae]QHZ52745.1 hypothetical protein ERICV_03646 [Paenibacillus larvae subsp. larvae]